MSRETELLLHNLKRVFARLANLSDETILKIITATPEDEIDEICMLIDELDNFCDDAENGNV